MGVVGFDWEPGFNRIIDIKGVSFELIRFHLEWSKLQSYKDSSMFITIRSGSSMILPDELCLTAVRLWGQLDQSMQRHFDIGKVFQGPGNNR